MSYLLVVMGVTGVALAASVLPVSRVASIGPLIALSKV
jgi:hypothetical protein